MEEVNTLGPTQKYETIPEGQSTMHTDERAAQPSRGPVPKSQTAVQPGEPTPYGPGSPGHGVFEDGDVDDAPNPAEEQCTHIGIPVSARRNAIAKVVAFEKNHRGEGIGDCDGSSTVTCGDNGITVRGFISLCGGANNDGAEPKSQS